MITRADAEQTVTRWARNESERSGRAVEPMVHEFDLGFIVWTRPVGAAMPEPGSGSKTVLDRESGDFTYYPSLSTNEVEGRYRDLIASRSFRAPSTVDKIAELRRQNERPITPNVAAHLTLAADGKLRRAFGAKSDSEINHHRFVKEWLDSQPAGHLVRGVERHAELIVVSDTLYELESQRPVSLEEARAALSRSRFETLHVRDRGDPLGGTRHVGCVSCMSALLHLGVVPSSPGLTEYLQQRLITSDVAAPEPDRFPEDVAAILVGGGWLLAGPSTVVAQKLVDLVLAGPSAELATGAIPAARAVFSYFAFLSIGQRAPGREVQVTPLTIDPGHSDSAVAALIGLSSTIGQPLFPLGAEEGGAILAVDATGRVFMLDQAGDWLVGNDLDAALINLVRGNRPLRLRGDGTFT